MKKTITACFLLVLVLVPAYVMAAGCNGQSTDGCQGKGRCVLDQSCQGLGMYLKNNQTGSGTACQAGTCLKERHGNRVGQGGANTTAETSPTNSCGNLLQTRTMKHLRDGSCGGWKRGTV